MVRKKDETIYWQCTKKGPIELLRGSKRSHILITEMYWKKEGLDQLDQLH